MQNKKNTYPELDRQKITSNKNGLVTLWHLLSGYHGHYALSAVMLAISAASRTGMYLFLGYFVDQIIGQGKFGTELLQGAATFMGLIMLQAFSGFLSNKLAAQTAESSTRRLRDLLFDHIQRLSFAYHSEVKTGDLLERASSDVDTIRRFIADQAVGVARIIVIFIINFTAIFQLNQRLALISIIIVPVILVISIFFFRKLSKAYEAYQEQEAVLSTNLQENLSGVRVVKAFARQSYEIKKFDQNNYEKYLRGKRLNLMHALFWPISDTICAAQMIASNFLAATMVIDGIITLGNFMTFSGLLGWLIWPIRNLGRLIVDTSRALVSLNRVITVLRVPEEPLFEGSYLPASGTVHGDISFEHVTFEYEKGHPVLEDVSFDAKAGQVIALLGSTGSGKTSLVNLLPRFYDITSGSIRLDGVDLREYPRSFLRSQIGIVEQEPFLFSCSIRDNITYGVTRPVTQEEIEAAAREAAIHDVILSFKDGYDTLVGERGVTLSGGQKQRVAIARTLLLNPRILIMDDSTSSVDMETEVQIREALQRLMVDRTTFIIAHRIQSIMSADLILVFDEGKIVQSGQHEDLIDQPGIYRSIFEIQTRIESALQEEIDSVHLL
ncbi:MAG TPA: ABC transporter ATP-binding protein [Anaerolineaceae bacterium]|nr:ABC transporter ATP-binding protein [Anaerolineaceae bacterium]HOR78296.1 ABC transporter ATP-binding protein [Anaerolineaceae bacterium]